MKANRLLTPGAVDPAATIASVSLKGYAAARRPTLWQALKLKSQAMKLYGIPRTPANWHAYRLDHLIPLCLAGQPLDINNVWPQRKASSLTKDRDENSQHRAVLNGSLYLEAAQQFFINHWSQ